MIHKSEIWAKAARKSFEQQPNLVIKSLVNELIERGIFSQEYINTFEYLK